MEPFVIEKPAKAAAASKSIGWNMMGFLAGAVELGAYLTQTALDTHLIPPGVPLMVVSGVNLVLRRLTNQPVRFFQRPPWLGGRS